ncbi:MAG: alpha/beta hydrolase family protein [Acidobacteriaceae bacterium]
MLKQLYAKWMYAWETKLTMRDTNRIVRPLEWGFDWLEDWTAGRNLGIPEAVLSGEQAQMQAAMLRVNESIVQEHEQFFGYKTPTDFRLEERHPQLYPTNVRPETLRQDAELKQLAAEGKLPKARFLRFTSPVKTPYPENDQVNARWYPAPPEKHEESAQRPQQPKRPKQAILVMPQWNADAFSHNVLCSLFNRFGVSALRLSKPFHDVRRPAELERSDYAVSANIGRTIAACRQAVVDVRSCLDWLEQQGYQQFGVLGTSLGSCYAFIASAHDARLRVNAFNHASLWTGDVVWTGQSTRHVRAACEAAGLSHDDLRMLWGGVSPMAYMDEFAGADAAGKPLDRAPTWPKKRARVIYAPYDLTFLREFSEGVLREFRQRGVDFDAKMLPCGHYTTGEFPYKYMDGWYLGSFVYNAFKKLAAEGSSQSYRSELATQ